MTDKGLVTSDRAGRSLRDQNTRRGREQQQQQRQSDDTSTHVSLTAMSTDDVSSMGETLISYHSTSRHRKRKDDCSESRCTITSEESARSRSRRRCRSLLPDQRRWLDRIDQKAAMSHAPIRPRRSDDDSLGQSATPCVPVDQSVNAALLGGLGESQATGFSFQNNTAETLPGIETTRHPETSNDNTNSTCLDAVAREVARCQSMSQPPVRPTRTRDDSKTDLMDDDEDESSSPDANNETEKDEIDPDMFVRLLSGEQVDGSVPKQGLAAVRSMGSHPSKNSAVYNPPTKPRRRSDADVYGRQAQCNPNFIRRVNTVASTKAKGSQNVCPHKSCQGMRESHCPHAISPKPPAKPSRTLDDSNHEGEAAFPNLAPIPSPPVKPLVRNVVDLPILGQTKANPFQHTISMSSRMDLEQAAEEKGGPSKTVQQVVAEEDETEVSISTSVKEYDPDLFARLLYPDSETSRKDRPRLPKQASAREQDPPPPLLARVSTSSTMPATPTQLGYNRFDHSAPCAMPEHIKGAVKSSHPPMQPRRSFDEGMHTAFSLASATAAACLTGGPCSMATNPSKPSICIVGGKRRYSRRLSRRSTLALTSELEPSQVTDRVSTAPSSELHCDPINGIDLSALEPSFSFQGEYTQQEIDAETSRENIGYQPILPARRQRRVVRRFTMPPKGGTLSPSTKKRRLVGRSLSCRSPAYGVTQVE